MKHLWGPVRLHLIFHDWFSTSRHRNENDALQGKDATSSACEKAPWEFVRNVKRNVFPASYLKVKFFSHCCVGGRGKKEKASGKSLIDITRWEVYLTKQCEGVVHSRNGIRQTTSQRRADWNKAISAILDGDFDHIHLLPQEHLSSNTPPVLPSNMFYEDDYAGILLGSFVAIRKTRPRKKMIVADIMSNVLFDKELLYAKSSCTNSAVDEFVRHNGCFEITCSICSSYFQDAAVKSPCSIASVPRESVEPESPILESVIRAKYRQRTTTLCTQLLCKNVDYSDSDTNSFFTMHRVTITEMCRKIAGIGTLGLEKPSIQVQKTQFEEQFFVKQRISHCERLQTPIVCLGVLLRQKDQYMSIQNILPLPLMLKIPAWNTELGDLLRYVRRLRTYEMGYWCEGSREILRKSRYYRKHLVYDIPPLHTQRIIHPCPALAKRDLPLYSLEASEQNTERTSAVFGVFHELTKKKRFPSKRWLKFARAVKKSVAEENHLSNKRRRSRIRECINTFDPPKRRHNVAGRETIQAMYSKTQQMGRAETPSRETEEQEEEGSQSFESFLRAIVYSAEDSEAIRADDGPLSTLLELGAQHTKEHERNAKGLSPNFINRKSHNSVAREGGRLSPLGELQEGAERRHDVGTRQESGKLFLEAPENLVCASSSLQLAAHFLRCNVRGVVYLPPQLSFLSALAVIINSFLSEPMCDHRVAVVCEPNAGMGETVNSYLDFTFDGKVSIDVARRADFASHPPLASLTKKTARVVILDSFEFTVSPGFALLIVFAPEVSSTLFEGPQSLSRSGTKVLSAASIWKSIPSVLVLPSYFHDTVISYSQKVSRFANLLDLKDTYFILEKDDIEHLLLLSRRSFLFLVPPRDVLEFIALLETEASSFFPAYQKIAAAEQCNTGGCISCLQDVDITVLENHLREEASHQRTETSGYTLEILYSLRQARSYALYDGYNAAVAYLNHYSQAASSKTLAALQSILADVPAPGQSSDKNSSETHPVATALENSFLSMEGEMENQAASLRSIHRRSKFRVLVITNSKESYDGLIKSLKNSRYILKAADGEIGLCELRHLWNGVESKRGGYRNEECEASTKFSHVYHVVNDRKGRSRDHFLPPLLMQYIHAGRTKLITVAVDETRTLESIHDRDVTLYRELSAAVQNIETREACRTLSYVTTISLLDVLASVNRLASPFEKINGMRPAEAVSLRDSTEGAGTNVILAPHRDLTRQERIRQQSFIETDVHMSAAEICMSSIPNIRQLLKAKLNSARCETNNGILTVVVKVAVGERCTPGTTFILAAIASDPDLLKHTKVTTILET